MMMSDWEKRKRLTTIWGNMKQRCGNPKRAAYKYYGAKGIKVCQEWEKFEDFYNWSLANGWQKQLSLDRIDPKGNYHPKNCEWITRSENTKRALKYHDGAMGRPKNSGIYGEPTTQIRVPNSLVKTVKKLIEKATGVKK